MPDIRGEPSRDCSITYSGRADRGKVVGELVKASGTFWRASILLRSSSLQVVLRGRPVSRPSIVEPVLKRFLRSYLTEFSLIRSIRGHFGVSEALLMQC